MCLGWINLGGCLEVWLLLVLNRLGWPLHLLSEWGLQETKCQRWPDVEFVRFQDVEFVRLGPGVAQIGATKKRGIISKLARCFLGFQVSSMFFNALPWRRWSRLTNMFFEAPVLPCFINFYSQHILLQDSGWWDTFPGRHFSIPTIHHDTELINHGDSWDTHGNP